MSAELKPCPLCKRPPHRNGRGNAGGVLCVGHTEADGGNHRFQTYGANQAEADEAWNRASTAATPGALDPSAQYEEEITAANQMFREGLITYDTLKHMVNLAARMRRESGALDPATVERCAQVAEDHGAAWVERQGFANVIAAAIRNLDTDPHQHGGKGA